MGSIKRVSHQSGKAKRRLYFKLQHWMWRKRWEEKCSFRKFTIKSQASRTRTSSIPYLISKKLLRKNKRRCSRRCTLNHTSAAVPLPACTIDASENIHVKSLLKPCDSDSVSEAFVDSGYLENHVTDTHIAAVTISQTVQAATETFVRGCETADSSNVTEAPRKVILPQRLEVESLSGQLTVPTGHDRAPNTDTEKRIPSTQYSQADVSLTALVKDIHGMHLPFLALGLNLNFSFSRLFTMFSYLFRIPQ